MYYRRAVADNRRHPRPLAQTSRVPLEERQVGRRPPNIVVVLLTGVMWVAVGVIMLLGLTTGWKWAVGLFSIGVGVLFLRGFVVAVLRRDRQP